MKIRNDAGEVIVDGLRSDAEAARWFIEHGRRGDFLADTGEDMTDVTFYTFGVTVSFDRSGCVLLPEVTE